MTEHGRFDVAIVGGGPAASTLACLLSQSGRSVVVLERDIHPREHVGESLTPATNLVLDRIGFMAKLTRAGFTPKPGVCWTAPTADIGKHIEIELSDFPIPGAPVAHSFNVERDSFDAMLLRHASEAGAHVLQGVHVDEIVFDGDRAIGVRVEFAPGVTGEIGAGHVVDASGRACVLGSQLGIRQRDPELSQLAMYSWFTGVAPPPAGTEGMLYLHFLGMERAWAWQIPLRGDRWSIGVVIPSADFRARRRPADELFFDLCRRNVALRGAMGDAEALQPIRVEADYSYTVERLAGPGWLLVGDACGFIDPVLSTGLDIALFSAVAAFEAIESARESGDERRAFEVYERDVGGGLEAWRDLVVLFYRLQVLFTYFAIRPRHREDSIRILQGNLFHPEALARARRMITAMKRSYEEIMSDPDNLLRPGALRVDGATKPSPRS